MKPQKKKKHLSIWIFIIIDIIMVVFLFDAVSDLSLSKFHTLLSNLFILIFAIAYLIIIHFILRYPKQK